MRYFTRDLYRRCRSTDETVLDAACAEWEQANEAYERHLQAIEPKFPPPLRELATLLLHDAKVQSIARQDNQLILVLHKDIPPRDLVILRYELAGEPVADQFADAPTDWSRPMTFEFDELDIEETGEGKLYTQSIVFANGWMMRLRFRDVRVTRSAVDVPRRREWLAARVRSAAIRLKTQAHKGRFYAASGRGAASNCPNSAIVCSVAPCWRSTKTRAAAPMRWRSAGSSSNKRSIVSNWPASATW